MLLSGRQTSIPVDLIELTMFRIYEKILLLANNRPNLWASRAPGELAPGDCRGAFMSLYQLQKALFQMNTDSERAQAYHDNPDRFLASYELSDEEVRWLKDVDLGAMYAMGVHPQFLAPFAGRANVGWKDYLAALENPGPMAERNN